MPAYQTPPPDFTFEQELIDVLLLKRGGRERGEWIDFLCVCCDDGKNPAAGYNRKEHYWTCPKCDNKGSWKNLVPRLEQLGISITLPTEKPRRREVERYPYVDEKGVLLYHSVRFEPKDFMQQAANGDWSIKDVRRVLYRLPQVIANPADQWVALCEGERDVHTAESLGFCSTTNAGGAVGGWQTKYGFHESLRGKRVVIIADNDEDGYKRVPKVWKDLKLTVAQCRVLTFAHLDGFPAKGDLTDWLTFGNVRKDSSHLRMLIEGAPTAETWIAAQGAPPSEGALPEFPCTVDGNALRLYHYFKDDLLYCPEDDEQWRVWRDPVWRRTKGSALISYARKLPAKIVEEAKATPKALRRLDLEKWEIQSQNTKVVQGAITLARGEERWWVEEDQFDRHPFLLACKNGVIDLETGKLHEHGRREDYLSRQSPIAFDRKCPTPNFTAYLKHLCGDDAELRKYTLQTLGRSLAGLQSKRPFFMLLGVKDTGKSTLLKLGTAILGPQLASSIRPEVIMEVRNEPHLTYLMTLRGKRLITFSECKQTHIMDRGAIKRFTGGDEIRANAMRQDEVSFHSECTLLVVSNEMPKTIGNDDAFYARLKIIRFKNSWTGPVDEMYFQRSLKPELPGILPQLVDACLDWQHNPFQPQSVTDEVEAYRRSQDVVQIYADEHLVKLQPDVAESRTHCSRVYGDFQRYCHDWGERRVPSGQEFNKRLETMGFIKDRKGGDTVWLNLGLLDHDHVSERYESRTYLPTNQ